MSVRQEKVVRFQWHLVNEWYTMVCRMTRSKVMVTEDKNGWFHGISSLLLCL